MLLDEMSFTMYLVQNKSMITLHKGMRICGYSLRVWQIWRRPYRAGVNVLGRTTCEKCDEYTGLSELCYNTRYPGFAFSHSAKAWSCSLARINASRWIRWRTSDTMFQFNILLIHNIWWRHTQVHILSIIEQCMHCCYPLHKVMLITKHSPMLKVLKEFCANS